METFYRTSDSSFIICTKDRPDDMVKCIKSILDQTILPRELIVIDAGKIQKVEKLVRGVLKGSRIDFIYQHTKPNLPYQRNIGVNMATGNIIFFFDDDTILDRSYHEEILNVYSVDKQEEVAGVMGVIKNEIQNPLLGKVFRKIFPLGGRKPKIKNYPSFPIDAKRIKVASHMWGCQMSLRRKVLNEHRFDEKMGRISGYAFLEDLEFTSRIAQRYVLLETSLAEIDHNVSIVTRDNVDILQEMTVINRQRIFKKNVPKTFINYLIFFWQQVGTFLHALAQTIRKKDSGWIKGVLKGYRQLLLKTEISTRGKK